MHILNIEIPKGMHHFGQELFSIKDLRHTSVVWYQEDIILWTSNSLLLLYNFLKMVFNMSYNLRIWRKGIEEILRIC